MFKNLLDDFLMKKYQRLYSSVSPVSSRAFGGCFSPTFSGVLVSERQPRRVNVSFLSFPPVSTV